MPLTFTKVQKNKIFDNDENAHDLLLSADYFYIF